MIPSLWWYHSWYHTLWIPLVDLGVPSWFLRVTVILWGSAQPWTPPGAGMSKNRVGIVGEVPYSLDSLTVSPLAHSECSVGEPGVNI